MLDAFAAELGDDDAFYCVVVDSPIAAEGVEP
jgi:hypothetical protein